MRGPWRGHIPGTNDLLILAVYLELSKRCQLYLIEVILDSVIAVKTADTTDSGNTLAAAKDLGDLTYNLTTLGALKSQEISETVGGNTDSQSFNAIQVSPMGSSQSLGD